MSLPSDWDPIFEAAAKRYNVDPNLLRSIMMVESNGNPRAVGPVTRTGERALGLMQLMPETARSLGVTDPFDPNQAIPAAAALMAQNLTRYGTPQAALMAYDGGTDPAKWNNPETQGYVPKIINAFKSFIVPSAEAKEPPPSSTNNGMTGADIRAMFDKQSGASAAPGADNANTGQDNGTESLPAVLRRLRGEQPSEGTPDAGLGDSGSSAPQSNQPITGADIRAQFDKAQPVAPAEPPNSSVSIPDASAPLSVKLPAPDNQGHSSAIVDMGLQPSIDAAKEAYANTPPLVNPNGPVGQWMRAHGLGNIATTPFPLAADVNALGAGALNAYQRGVMYLGNKLGMPLLARDIAALPEAMPGNSDIHPLPKAADGAVETENKLAPKAAATAPSAPPLLGEDFKAAPFAPSYHAPEGAPTGETMPVAPTANPANKLAPASTPAETANKLAPEAVAAPSAVNATEPAAETVQAAPAQAAATPAPDETVTATNPLAPGVNVESQDVTAPKGRLLPIRTQAQADAEADRILRHFAGSGNTEIDTSSLIPGSHQTLSQAIKGGNAGIAGLERSIRDAPGQSAVDFQKVEDANKAARAAEAQRIIGTQPDIEALEAQRDEATQADHDKVFAPENLTPTEPTTALQVIDKTLAGRQGQRPVVKSALEDIRSRLVDADGNLQTDPDLLYGIRMSINDAISPKAAGTAGDARQAAAELMQVRAALDNDIEKGAPGFKDYIDQYAKLSAPIDGMQYLQNMRLTDANGNITLGKLDNAIKSLEAMRGKNGINAATNVTDEQLAALKNLRDDFRLDNKREIGRAIGSPTVQKLGTNRLMDVMGHPIVQAATKLGSVGTTLANPWVGVPMMLATQRMANLGEAGRAMVMESLRRKLLNPEQARSAFQQPPTP